AAPDSVEPGPSRLSADAFVERLRSEGSRRYHNHHPFNAPMHAGQLAKAALILSKSEDPAFRRAWTRRIGDHDGTREGEGGLVEWLVLARGLGLDEAEVQSCRGVLPAVHAVCDSYVE